MLVEGSKNGLGRKAHVQHHERWMERQERGGIMMDKELLEVEG